VGPLAIFHTVAGGALLALAIQTLLNVRHLPRLERMPPPSRFPRVAVLLPARNEAARIGKAVRAWMQQSYPDAGILVYDDASADGTGVLAAAAGGDRVRVLRGGPLPAGWRGKTHASHQLREHADAEILLFADADVTPAASTLAATVSALQSLNADALSALPRHESAHLGIRALVALQNWAPLAYNVSSGRCCSAARRVCGASIL
jgi:chlorobactene glucosyltransferase